MRTIFQQINLHAAFSPMKPCIVLPDRFITYEMLRVGVASVQCVLPSLELDRDQLVGVLVDNPIRHLITALALLRSGYSFCPMRADEREFAISCGARTIITDARLPLAPGVRVHFLDEKWFLNPQDASELDALLGSLASCAHHVHVRVNGPAEGDRVERRNAPPAHSGSLRSRHGDELALSHQSGLSGAGLSHVLAVLFRGGTVYIAPISETLKMVSDYAVNELRASTSQVRHLMEQAATERYCVRIPLAHASRRAESSRFH